jgi:hypothetical protein
MRSFVQHSGGAFSRLLSFLTVSFVFAAFLGGAPTTAAPVKDVQVLHKTIFARACPAVTDIVPQLKAKGLAGNTVFYTRPVTNQQASSFAQTLTPLGQGYFSLVDFNQQMDWIDQCNLIGPGQTTAGEQDKLTLRISQALAEGATGTAYILIDAGADINAPGSIWGTVEFPTLQRNTMITQVVRVDPANTGNSSPVWKAGDPITLPPSTAP